MFILDSVHAGMKSPFFIFVLLYFGVFSLSIDPEQALQPPPPPPAPLQPPSLLSPQPPLLRSPPPPRKVPHPPGSRNTTGLKSHHRKHHRPPPPPPPPQSRKNLKFAKKLGLIFAGLAAILQFCVVTFLVIKRQHLIKTHR